MARPYYLYQRYERRLGLAKALGLNAYLRQGQPWPTCWIERRASWGAETCDRCSRHIRSDVWKPDPAIALCGRCAPRSHEPTSNLSEWAWTRRCDHCGRAVHGLAYDRRPGWGASYCSPRCRRLERDGRVHERRAEAREDMTCEVCGATFTPARGDAQTCSNACRQRAYRARRSSTPLALPPRRA